MKYDILNQFKEYLESKYCKNTAAKYYSSVKNALKDLDFSSLNDISEGYIKNKMQNTRTKNKFSALKNGLKNLHEFDSDLQLPEETVFKEMAAHKRNWVKSKNKKVDVDTIKRKVNAGCDPKMKYACRLAMVSGLRVAELADLKAKDISFNDNTKIIYVSVRNGKGGRSRESQCLKDPYLYNHLKDYVEQLPPSEKLFYSESTIRRYAWKNGMEMHDFRRIFANLLKEQLQEEGLGKEDIKNEVQKRLGHARFSNTKRYLYGRKIIIKHSHNKQIKEPDTTAAPKNIQIQESDLEDYYAFSNISGSPEPNNESHININNYGFTNCEDSQGNDSLRKYTDSQGRLLPEREQLHKKIINDFFYNVRPASEKATFTIMGGGPASGKSTMLEAEQSNIIRQSLTIDSDRIKAELPEYKEMLTAKDFNAANYVHEESSALAKRILNIAINDNYNVILDGTGDGSNSSLMSKISQAKAAGLNVYGIYATCPTDVAISRAQKRAEVTGREVPELRIAKIHSAVSKILPVCAPEFDQVKLYDTTYSLVLIATGGSGQPLKAIPGQEKLFEKFIEKGKSYDN